MVATREGFDLVDLKSADWGGIAALVLAPGVPLTHPEPHWVVKAARAAGVEIIGDVELFFRERSLHCPEAPVIAITGTNGKSTTTALTAHILQSAGRDVQMGGNIGRAILTLDPPTPERVYVLELSSFQIDLTPSLAPTVGVLLNLTPDHLDRHGPAHDLALAMRSYAAIKERLVAASKVALISVDDDYCAAIAGRLGGAAGPSTYPVSVRRQLDRGYFAIGSRIAARGRPGAEVLGDIQGVSTLRGQHNLQNAAFACAAASHVGVTADAIAAALPTYPGLPHRMEEIGRAGSVLFINDSKATNADSTEKALSAFDSGIYWIVGGKPKEGGITSLAPYFSRVAKAYLIGAATEEFAAALDGKVAFERCGTLDRAVEAAARNAARSASAEPVVLLSPACASYDQYKNFEERGVHFRRLVSALPGIEQGARTS